MIGSEGGVSSRLSKRNLRENAWKIHFFKWSNLVWKVLVVPMAKGQQSVPVGAPGKLWKKRKIWGKKSLKIFKENLKNLFFAHHMSALRHGTHCTATGVDLNFQQISAEFFRIYRIVNKNSSKFLSFRKIFPNSRALGEIQPFKI